MTSLAAPIVPPLRARSWRRNRIRTLADPRRESQSKPQLRLLPRREGIPEELRAPSPAGLIVITGPPLSGKQALGHYVNEYLPDSVHLSQTDPVVAGLTDEDPEALGGLLKRIRSELRCGRKVVFSARLASPFQRRRVLDVAREVGVPRMLVEVEGTDPAALERASEVAETLKELREVLCELKALLPAYRHLTRGEQGRLRTLTVPAEQPVEDQVKSVLDGWGRLGAVH